MFNTGDSFVAARDTVRAARADDVRAPDRATGVALRDFVALRAVVVGRVVRAVTDVSVERVAVVTRGATVVVVVVRAATFFVALRGSAATGAIAVRAFVAPERVVAVADDFCDWVIVFAPRDGADVETFVAVVRDAARAISS